VIDLELIGRLFDAPDALFGMAFDFLVEGISVR